MKRSGTADLPLHGGRVPSWLAERMTQLGGAIVEAIISEFGPRELLRRMSDPFWFQALGSVMGMDWHSSGITTSVMGALKRAINPVSRELGIAICGGRGRHSRRTPFELEDVAMRFGVDGRALARASRLSAKVDNTCLQDGFSLYLHSFIVTSDGDWAVVQQGMDTSSRMARRYHWHSRNVTSFTADPHSAVVGRRLGTIINLSDRRSVPAQHDVVSFFGEHPDRQRRELEGLLRAAGERHDPPVQAELLVEADERRLVMPVHHEVRAADIDSRRLGAVLALARDREIHDFADALLLEGLGPRTMQSLALVAEVIYGDAVRFDDPARFSFAHGGKDGHPFPVPLKVYDESIGVLRRAVERARMDGPAKLEGLRRLSELARRIEQGADPRVDIEGAIREERRESPRYGGRTVGGPATGVPEQTSPTRPAGRRGRGETPDGQLPLF